jgi:O-antigen/teichoic acid export membrane protein
MVTTNWTGNAVVSYGVKEFVATGRIAGIFWTRTAILAVNLLAVIATSPLWLAPLTRVLRVPPLVVPLLLFHLCGVVVWNHLQQALMAAKLPRSNALLLTFERVVVVLCLLTLWRAQITSLRLVVVVYIAGAVAAAAVAVIVLRRVIFPLPAITRDGVVEVLRFSAPLLPSALVSYFASGYLDSFFVARFINAAAVGVYAVAYQVAGAVMVLNILAGSLMQPFFISVAPDRQAHTIRQFATRVLPLMTLAWSVLVVVGAAIGGPLLLRVFGPQYAAIAPVLWPLVACITLGTPVVIGYFPIAYATGRTYIVAVNAIVAASINVVLDLVLIPRYGLLGCAWGTVAAYVAALVVTILLSDRAIGARTMWTAVAAFPAIAAAAVVLTQGPLAAIAAAVFAAGAILALRFHGMREGAAMLYRALLRKRGMPQETNMPPV